MMASSGEKDVEKGGNTEDATPLNGQEAGDGDNGIAVVRVKRDTFVAKFRAISVEKPPSKNPIDFILAILGLCCCLPATACLVCCCLGVLLFQCIPIAEVVIGTLYFDDQYCPQENIALLLVVGGCIGIVTGLLEGCCGGRQIQDRKESGGGGVTVTAGEERKQMSPGAQVLVNLLRIASLCWLIASAVIVYRFYGDVSYADGDPNFCEPLMYRFLFWIVTISLAILAMVPVVLCCACCVATIAIAGADDM